MTTLAIVSAGILTATVVLLAYLTFVFLRNTPPPELPAALPDPAACLGIHAGPR